MVTEEHLTQLSAFLSVRSRATAQSCAHEASSSYSGIVVPTSGKYPINVSSHYYCGFLCFSYSNA